MNEAEEEYQPLDIALVRYSTEDATLRNDVSERQTELKEQSQSIAKTATTEETNPAEIYLFDQPQIPIRQEPESSPTHTTQTSDKDDDLPHTGSGHKEVERSPLVDSTTFQDNNGRLLMQSGLSSRPDEPQPSLRESEGFGQRTSEKQIISENFTTGPFETTKIGNGVSQVAEQPFYVNAKQYYRILKRRYARAKLEENLRISRERKPYLHESRHKHAMRRPRGQGGRFLTIAEIEAMKSKELSDSARSSSGTTPSAEESKELSIKEPPVITQQDTSQNKLAAIKKNDS